MIIKMADLRGVGVCIDGAKAFFDSHGIDWTNFLVNGIDTQELLDLSDALSTRIVNDVIRKAIDHGEI